MNTFCLTHRILLAAKVLLPWIGIVVAATVFAVLPAQGGPISISGTGQTLVSGIANTPSAVYRTVSAGATLDISGNTLTLVLANTSPTDSIFKAEALSSFYFDIAKGAQRPTLAFTSADGPLYQVFSRGSDTRYSYAPPAVANGNGTFTAGAGTSNLMATKPGDGTWQFNTMNPITSPFLGFGIGTVGNTDLNPNSFNGNWVKGPKNVPGDSMISFSIYRSTTGGDISPGNSLDKQYLLMNSGTFRFNITDGKTWTNDDIRHEAVFGFGTNPDGIVTVTPEPSAYVLALVGAAAVAYRYRSRRKGHARHDAAP
jgi:hypothetical protein